MKMIDTDLLEHRIDNCIKAILDTNSKWAINYWNIVLLELVRKYKRYIEKH
jgi:hypothetical protein